jgi:hypothetical protein
VAAREFPGWQRGLQRETAQLEVQGAGPWPEQTPILNGLTGSVSGPAARHGASGAEPMRVIRQLSQGLWHRRDRPPRGVRVQRGQAGATCRTRAAPWQAPLSHLHAPAGHTQDERPAGGCTDR